MGKSLNSGNTYSVSTRLSQEELDMVDLVCGGTTPSSGFCSGRSKWIRLLIVGELQRLGFSVTISERNKMVDKRKQQRLDRLSRKAILERKRVVRLQARQKIREMYAEQFDQSKEVELEERKKARKHRDHP